MKVFFNIVLIQTILNLYVFIKGWQLIPPRYTVVRTTFLSFFMLEILIYIVTYIWFDSLPVDTSKIFIQLCTLWCFFVLYLSIILLAISLIQLLCRLIARTIKKRFPTSFSINFKRGSYIFSMAFALALLLWGNFKFMHPQINHKPIRIEKEISQNHPNPLRIVMFSDIHLGYLNDNDVLEMYVDLVMKQKPDIILIGGDIIDFSLRPLLEYNMAEELNRLKAPFGVYACLGNHDHYLDERDKIKWLKEKTNITILQDSVAFIDSTLYVVGREDFKSPHKSLDELLVGIDKSLPVFVLNHQPKNLNEEVLANIDLSLYGHTHDGQIFPLTIILKMVYDLSAGYEHRQNSHLFVTSGLGGIPQLRIGSESEIIVVDCTFSKTHY